MGKENDDDIYNCHSYAWHNTKEDPDGNGSLEKYPQWDNNPIDDDSLNDDNLFNVHGSKSNTSALKYASVWIPVENLHIFYGLIKFFSEEFVRDFNKQTNIDTNISKINYRRRFNYAKYVEGGF